MFDIEQEIQEVNGTMALEGMPLTNEEKENLRAILRGEVTFKEMKRIVMAKYIPPTVAHERV
jgi:hypothetical protein